MPAKKYEITEHYSEQVGAPTLNETLKEISRILIQAWTKDLTPAEWEALRKFIEETEREKTLSKKL